MLFPLPLPVVVAPPIVMLPAISESIAVPAEARGLGRDCFGDDDFGAAAEPFPPGTAGALPSPEAISSSSLGR